jgi:hypothetical protein
MSDLRKSDSRAPLPLTGLTAYNVVIFYVRSSKRLTPLQFTCRTGRLEKAGHQVGVREQTEKKILHCHSYAALTPKSADVCPIPRLYHVQIKFNST